MHTVYITIHLGICVLVLQAAKAHQRICIVMVKKLMEAQPLICILLVCGHIMWRSAFGDLLSCPRG